MASFPDGTAIGPQTRNYSFEREHAQLAKALDVIAAAFADDLSRGELDHSLDGTPADPVKARAAGDGTSKLLRAQAASVVAALTQGCPTHHHAELLTWTLVVAAQALEGVTNYQVAAEALDAVRADFLVGHSPPVSRARVAPGGRTTAPAAL